MKIVKGFLAKRTLQMYKFALYSPHDIPLHQHVHCMHLTWHGASCLKISAKPFEEEVVVMIDPYKPAEGAFPRSMTGHIALFTRGEDNAIPLSGDPFIISTPGEYEIKGVLVTATAASDGSIVYRIDAEHMSVGHLGQISSAPEGVALDTVNGVDILCLPVGGKGTLDTEAAVKVSATVEPRIVIPMAFRSDVSPDALPAADFLKEMGVVSGEAEKKLVLKKKDLPQEDLRVVLLEKE